MKTVRREKLGSLFKFQNGRAFKTQEWSAAGIPIIRIQNLNDANAPFNRFRGLYDGNIFVREGDLLFSWSGTVGSSFGPHIWNRDPGLLNQHIFKVSILAEVDKRYAYYALAELTKQIESQVNGAVGLSHITKEKLIRFTIPVPPFPEQHRIVRILDEAFAAIAKAKANTEKNLQNARSLFESELQSLFTSLLIQGTIPIGTVATIYDGPHATPKTVEIGPIFLGISALLDGRVNLGQTRHVTKQDFERWTRRVKPRANDIVFSYETRLGQAALIPEGLDCCLGRRMGLIRVDEQRVLARFLVYQYVSQPFRTYLTSKVMRGATVDRISIKHFPSFKIALPTLLEQKQIADRLDTVRRESERLAQCYRSRLTALDALKQSLLHQAFSGAL